MGAFRFFILIFVTWFGCGAAFADKRVALVIGNSAYKNVARLTNPVNDAAAVVGMFKNAGFDEVVSRLDLNVVEMRRALREFGNKARDADIAVIYYAGHGIEMGGGSTLRAASIAARKVSDVRSSAAPRSPQRRTKYP